MLQFLVLYHYHSNFTLFTSPSGILSTVVPTSTSMIVSSSIMTVIPSRPSTYMYLYYITIEYIHVPNDTVRFVWQLY